MAKDEKKQAARITGQFRSRDGMVYDFICESIRITISVTPSDVEHEWRAEAVAKQLPHAPSVNGIGLSRGAAIDALAQSWKSEDQAEGVPWLDWVAIREALTAVRAI
ncbi:MAG: hypothetical protein ABW133_10625 [Polyangiaceae bacterium]